MQYIDELVSTYSMEDIHEVLDDFVDFLVSSGHYNLFDAKQAVSNYSDEIISMISLRPLYDYFLDTEVDCRLGVKGDKEDGLLWLGLQFGYTEEQLNDILYENSEDEIDDSFLNEVEEEAREGEYLRGEHLYFYGKSTVRELLRHHDEHKQVTATKECSCGLFDAHSGDGSSMGIELKENVVIPDDLVLEFVPDVDTRSSYSVYSTYGFTPDGHLIVK